VNLMAPPSNKKSVKGTLAKGKGKQPKRFLEKNDALELAATIADIQEEKARDWVEKHHATQIGKPKVDTKPKVSASKLRLKEAKARLATQQTLAKKDKARARKQQNMAVNEAAVPHEGEKIEKMARPRKRVSFA